MLFLLTTDRVNYPVALGQHLSSGHSQDTLPQERWLNVNGDRSTAGLSFWLDSPITITVFRPQFPLLDLEHNKAKVVVSFRATTSCNDAKGHLRPDLQRKVVESKIKVKYNQKYPASRCTV